MKNSDFRVHTVTPGEGHYFFGYYDKCPWDETGRYMLAMKADFMDRPPRHDDAAEVGIIDLEKGNSFIPLDKTRAWNWQQGCMLQWLAPGKIIYNTREGDRYAAVILDIKSGRKRTLPASIYALSPDGRSAATVNFSRLHANRPGYGYAGIEDPWKDDRAPADDGIYSMDIEKEQVRLIISLRSVADSFGWEKEVCDMHWFNHLEFNTDGSRFAFLHRWGDEFRRRSLGVDSRAGRGSGVRITQFFSASPDGTDLRCIADDGMTSHFDWRDEENVLAWARRKPAGDRYFLFNDRTLEAEVIGEGVLTCDGHCSYSPDRKWILTDTYPSREDGKRTLLLYNPDKEERIDLGRFYGPNPKDHSSRCDLHPRWDRSGKRVCFDSIHEGKRSMYVMDVSSVTASGPS